MKEKTCCFTGHRHIPPEHLPVILKKLNDTLTTYIRQGYQYFGAGGALGFDTLAAQTVINLKEQYPNIKLILVLPCKDQGSRWSPNDVEQCGGRLDAPLRRSHPVRQPEHKLLAVAFVRLRAITVKEDLIHGNYKKRKNSGRD